MIGEIIASEGGGGVRTQTARSVGQGLCASTPNHVVVHDCMVGDFTSAGNYAAQIMGVGRGKSSSVVNNINVN